MSRKKKLDSFLQPKPDQNYTGILKDPAFRYKILLDVNNAIVNHTDPENFFKNLSREIRKVTHYDRFSISIYESDSHSLSWFAMADGIEIKEIDGGPRLLNKNTIAGRVVTSRKPLVIQNMEDYTHWYTIRLLIEEGIRTAIGVPLIVRDKAIGSLNFCFKNPHLDINVFESFLTDLSGQVATAVDNLLSHIQLEKRNVSLKEQKSYLLKQIYTRYSPDKFHYSSHSMKKIMQQVEVVADSDADVLLTGETGTGKDHIARHIHLLSPRSEALFVKVNCPALTPSLFESELFGHSKGAFTGAGSKRVGRFEMAKDGTIFLDEIAELPVYLQTKLLHVLEDRQFERVGDSQPIEANFRVIAATNADLQMAMSKKSFRSDLYYRLNTIHIEIPPLRERIEDIELILRHLTQSQALNLNRAPPIYSSEVIDLCKKYKWPGNVREMENLVNHLMILFSGKTVTIRDVQPLLSKHERDPCSSPMTLREVERAHLKKILCMTKGLVGGKSGAAAVLKMPKSTLQYKLRTHGLNPRDFRHGEEPAIGMSGSSKE